MQVRTVKLHCVVCNRLGPCPPRALPDICTAPFSLALHEKHDHNNRNADANKNNGKGPKAPAEVEVMVEQICDLGAREGTADTGGAVDAEHDHSILERSHIGQHDLDDVEQPDMSDPVERVRGRVHLDCGAGGLHDQADKDQDQHEQEALDSAPDVDDLGQGEFRRAAQDHRDDADDGEQAVFAERGGDVRVQ